MEIEQIKELIVKHLHGELTEAERLTLHAWVAEKPGHQQLFEELKGAESFTAELKRYAQLPSEKGAWERHLARYPLPAKPWISIAFASYRKYAAILLLIVTVLAAYILLGRRQPTTTDGVKNTPASLIDISPGKNQAMLTLANGEKILLDTTQATLSLKQGASTLVNKSGQLVYTSTTGSSTESLYNTLTTAKGQAYPLELSDGTKIWLNAGSSIHFPVMFTGKARKVTISGEAYFEVAKRNGEPFIVTITPAKGQHIGTQVEVLGTIFNINSYQDEPVITTTLLEGSVRLRSLALGDSAGASKTLQTAILQPGQQAEYAQGKGDIRLVKNADIEKAIAWKNGYFQFEDNDLQTVMRQLARWYDVEVFYEGKIPTRVFSGEIDRTLNASDVLKVLENANVHFRIEEGKRIIVTH